MKEIINNNAAAWEQALLQRLRAQGSRLTRTRRALIKALAQSQDWQRPEDLLANARPLCPSLSLVTVYRTLDLFARLGFVRRVHLSDGCHGYARTLLAHGHHLICRNCQYVVEFPGTENLKDLVARIQRETGFLIQEHMLEFQGLCPNCQEGAS